MDNDNYFLTQEGNLEDSGICGDTTMDELIHTDEDCGFGDLPVSSLVHTNVDVENEESDCFGDVLVSDLMHSDGEDEECCFGDLPVSELEHSGVKGMRWGVRRYQNPDGSLTPAGKKRYNKTLEKVRAEEKKLKEKAKAEKTTAATRSKIDKLNARVDAVNKKKQALKEGKKLSDDDDKPKTEAEKEAEKKAYEEAKAKAIKSGSATEVLKYKGDLTPQEMQSVTTRLQWEQNMQNISSKELAAGKNKTDKLFENMDKVTNHAVTAAKAWNMTANIVNAFANLDVSLPKIDTNIGNDNKDTRQKEKKAKKDAEPKEKSALEKLKEETAWIDAQNKNREAKRASRRHDESDAKEAAKKAAEKAKTDAWGEPEQTNSADGSGRYGSGKKSDNDSSGGAKGLGSGKSEKRTVYEGDVIGEGTSKGSSNRQKYSNIVDADWTAVTVSNVPATTRSRGESYINSVLGLPAPDDD